ncbi:hypothetical protein [Trichloromonas sp.]|uniref:hypothetical protein n=1 Tax=Trichloromonas sp. TaxID=3069249 RepID=UPI002A4C4E95|nr:hypothetical protein [Trichloromonas sp.]
MKIIRSVFLLTWSLLFCCLAEQPTLAAEAGGSNLTLRSSRISLGYRAVDVQDHARRAAQYTLFDSGATVATEFKYLNPSLRFMIEGEYINDSDYRLETDLDYRGLVRLDASTEKLYHHLDYFSYDRPDAVGTTQSAAGLDQVEVRFNDRSPGEQAALEVGIDKVHLRAKLPLYSLHMNLGYWRLQRSGHKQLRYLNEDCSACHLETKRQQVDRVTEEVTLGLDAHAGYVNVAVEQLFREFRDRESAPFDSFGVIGEDGDDYRLAGNYRHDAVPDSRLTATTLKVSTSPAGGFNAAAGYTIGKKENLSRLADVSPVEAETDFHKASADLTLVPRPELTLNFRYRMLDQESSSSTQLLVGGVPGTDTVATRQNMDLDRASYFGKLAWRPFSLVTLMGEFEHRDVHRDRTGEFADSTDPYYDPLWELPEDEGVNRFRASLITRPLGDPRLKFTGWYEFQTSDAPAYGASLEERHRFYAGAAWNPSERFGATANIRLTDGHSSNFERSNWNNFLDRRERQETVTAGFWTQLTDTVNANLYYGFLRSELRQDLTYGFGAEDDNSLWDTNIDYRQRVHTLTLSTNWQLRECLRTLFEARYIRSRAYFTPGFPPETLPQVGDVDAADLRSLSELDIVQMGLGLELEWTPAAGWNCSAHFSHDDYEDRNSNNFDGAAQLYMVSVARSW